MRNGALTVGIQRQTSTLHRRETARFPQVTEAGAVAHNLHGNLVISARGDAAIQNDGDPPAGEW